MIAHGLRSNHLVKSKDVQMSGSAFLGITILSTGFIWLHFNMYIRPNYATRLPLTYCDPVLHLNVLSPISDHIVSEF